MEIITKPQVLDAVRVIDNDRGDLRVDHAQRADLLEHALHDTAAYAEQLWANLNAMRTYLMDSQPGAPLIATEAGDGRPSTGTPETTHAWSDWIDAYAAVTSVLCGPHGDSGFGRESAEEVARIRGVHTAPGR